jgi:hypothetical protein
VRRWVLLLAAWSLFHSPARGAEIAALRTAPVQLSFAFAAPAALALQTPALVPTAPISLSASAASPAALMPAAAAPIAAAPNTVAAAPATAARPKRSTKIDYEEFGRQIAGRPGISTNVFQHADAKRRILRASGYDVLYGAGGRRIALGDATDARVGAAFANVMRAFSRL